MKKDSNCLTDYYNDLVKQFCKEFKIRDKGGKKNAENLIASVYLFFLTRSYITKEISFRWEK